MKHIILISSLIISFSGMSDQAQAKTAEYQLDNGMKLVVREDHRAPVVVSQVWYKIGSSYEQSGTTGVSHVLEHMMFKGTKTLKSGEFSKIVAENGGKENAFTSKDYTAYFQRISSDRLELCLRLEADRMRNLVFVNSEFEKELAVVKEERRWRVDNKPRSKLFEQFNATAFINSPTRIPTIGWMADLDHLTLKNVKQWYQRWYAPNNATLVIVGDVDADHVFELTKKHFGKNKAMAIEGIKPRKEIPQLGTRQITLHDNVSNPYLLMGYKVPVLNTTDDPKTPYILDVIAGVLDGGDSARFAKKLLRGDELAVSVGTSYDLYDRIEGLFLFAGTPTPKTPIADLKSAIIKQLDRLKTQKVSQSELDKVIAQVVASKIYDRDSMFNMGMQIGSLESVGIPWQNLDDYEKNIKSVTAEEILNVAKRYFIDDTLTVGLLLPKTKKGEK